MNGEEFVRLDGKIDVIKSDIDHIRDTLDIKFANYDEHVKDGPIFRDKVTKLETHLKYIWAILFILIIKVLSTFLINSRVWCVIWPGAWARKWG